MASRLSNPSAFGPPAPIGWRPLAPILAIQFIGTLGYSIAIPFLVFLVRDFGGASWTYGVVGATYSACQLVGAPLLGRWSDRIGRRFVLMVSQGGTVLAWLVFLGALALPVDPVASFGGAVLTVPLLLVFGARALDGLTGGNISVANAYVADLTASRPEDRQVAFGRMGMAASLGFAVGPALAALLGATAWGYRAPVMAAATISAVALVLCLNLREPAGACPEGPPSQPALTRVLHQQPKRCDRPPAEATAETTRHPVVRALLAATFVLFLAFNLFYAGFPVHADLALGWGAARMGMFFAVLSGAMILAQGPLLRRVSQRLAPSRVFALGILALIASFVAFGMSSEPTLFAGAIAFALGNGLAWPTFQARLASAAGPEAQGAVQGAATSVGSLASIFGLVAGGLLYPDLGVALFWLGAGLFGLVLAGIPHWFTSAAA
ncbi:MAG: MFS transporter [Myxococcota bacterium]